MRRVVITGMSIICSLGDDHNDVFNALCEKKQVLKEIDEECRTKNNLKTKYIVPLFDYSTINFPPEMKQVCKRGSINAVNSVYGAWKALNDSGIEKADENTMVFVGEGVTTLCEMKNMVDNFNENHRIHPMSVPIIMPNSSAAWISITFGIHGGSSVISTACSSGTDAIGTGYSNVKSGKCDMAICGGNDYACEKDMIILKGFEQLRAVTASDSGQSYPFSEEHEGFLFSEGASAFLILEELEHALARNAHIYAEITGYESSCDAHNIVAMLDSAEHISKMIANLINNKKIDYYNAHGTGTVLNDNTEKKMLHQIFGESDNQPAINSTKAFIGHSFGASGAVEAVVCVDSIKYNKIHGNICRTISENLNFTSETRDIEINKAVSASFGFGGHNAALMIERCVE